MNLTIIAAVAKNRVIGRDNQLIWRLPDDMKFFKTVTSGHHIIMGRRTWDSMGRPLPNRTNIVISRNPDFAPEGAIVVPTLEAAIAKIENDDEPFIIGGGEIYALALDVANKMYLTEIDGEFEGDRYFPEFDASNWNITNREPHNIDDRHDHSFTIVTYEK